MEPQLGYQKTPTREQLAGRYPWLGSIKWDGIRALDQEEALISRTWKPIRSAYAQKHYHCFPGFTGLDGELVPTEVTEKYGTLFAEATSRCNTKGDMRPLLYYVFDWVIPGSERLPFIERYHRACRIVGECEVPGLKIVEQRALYTYEQILEFEAKSVGEFCDQAEGIMLRQPLAPYKYGRSTLNEGYLVKFVQWESIEGVIEDTYEQMENTNEATQDAFGRTERSSSKAGKAGKGTLGGFVVTTKEFGQFRCGGGPFLTVASRARLWAVRETLHGGLLNMRYKKFGIKDKPRFPQAYGLKDALV